MKPHTWRTALYRFMPIGALAGLVWLNWPDGGAVRSASDPRSFLFIFLMVGIMMALMVVDGSVIHARSPVLVPPAAITLGIVVVLLILTLAWVLAGGL